MRAPGVAAIDGSFVVAIALVTTQDRAVLCRSGVESGATLGALLLVMSY
jgi:hypothetical protein